MALSLALLFRWWRGGDDLDAPHRKCLKNCFSLYLFQLLSSHMRFRALAFFLAGGLATLTALEVVLHLMPTSTGFRFLAVNNANPVLRGTPGLYFSKSIGWSFF